jgi:hypothetical protein
MEDTNIQQAVKAALWEKSLNDFSIQLTQNSTQMAAGFASVHTKQDQTNGQVQLHGVEIATIKSRAAYERLIWYLFTASIGVITYLLTKGH